MHHAVGAVKTIHRTVEGHDEDPTAARVARIVDELGKDELGVVLGRHDTEDNRPRQTGRDGPEGAEQVEARKPAVRMCRVSELNNSDGV